MASDTISTLNNLIETCKDGELGFKTAAEGLQSSETKAKFLEYSRQRAEMARELQAEVRRLGEDPEKAGSVSASLHRGWIDISRRSPARTITRSSPRPNAVKTSPRLRTRTR